MYQWVIQPSFPAHMQQIMIKVFHLNNRDSLFSCATINHNFMAPPVYLTEYITGVLCKIWFIILCHKRRQLCYSNQVKINFMFFCSLSFSLVIKLQVYRMSRWPVWWLWGCSQKDEVDSPPYLSSIWAGKDWQIWQRHTIWAESQLQHPLCRALY